VSGDTPGNVDRIVNLCKNGVVTENLGADLLAVVARINRLASQRARMPLPFAQGRLLSTIEDQGAARISDLAAIDHCSQPTMTTQVRRLEDAGLVSRTVDPDDARAVLIRITPKGVETLRQVRVDRGAAIDPYLERLDDADRQTLDDAIRVMRNLLDDAAAPKPTAKNLNS
jgi:DNA-binding MarR family transcriptional regulator